MAKIKLRLFVKELPSGKIINLANKHYTITRYDQSIDGFNSERNQITMAAGSPVLAGYNPNIFAKYNGVNLKDKGFSDYKNNIRQSYLDRESNTDVNGFTKIMDLPVGKYAIWIKDHNVQNKIARVRAGSNILLHGFEVLKEEVTVIGLDIQIKQFYCYKLIDQISRKPLANVKFNLYTLDENNKPTKINRPDIKRSVTDKNGMTPLLYSIKGEIVFVGFERGNIERFAQSNIAQPHIVYSPKSFQLIEWPVVKAITEKPVDTKVNLQQVGKIPIIFNFLDCEACILSPENFAKFEEESRQLDKVFLDKFSLNKQLDEAILNGSSSSQISEIENKIKVMEQKVAEHLNQNFKSKSDLVEVFVVTSYKTENSKDVKHGFVRRYLKMESYKNNYRDQRLNLQNFQIDKLSKGLIQSVKNRQISQELKTESFNQLKKLEVTLLKHDFYKTSGHIDLPEIGGAFYTEVKSSDSFDVSGSAQWLRAVGGSGLSTSINWNPTKGDVGAKVQATAQAKLILAEAGFKANLCIPSRSGVSLKYYDINLGALRAIIFSEISAFAGAKVATGFGLSLGYNATGEPELTADGIIYPTDKSIAEDYDSINKRPTYNIKKDEDKSTSQKGFNANTNISVDAFAGVEAGIKVGAGLEWLSPESKKFENIASVAPKVSGQLGGGLGFNFEITFVEGQFRIKVKAAMCLGVGAKGELELLVSPDKLLLFNKCIAYQLRQNHTKLLAYIAIDAFKYLQEIQLISIFQGTKLTYYSAKFIEQVFSNLYEDFKKDDRQRELAININKNADFLLYATPETRGMLLFLLIQDNSYSHIYDRPSVSYSSKEIHFSPDRKQAILIVFKSIMIKADWDNTLQHMTKDGSKSNETIAWLESRIIFFLNNGRLLANQNEVNDAISEGRSCIFPPSTGNSILDQYIKLRCTVLENVPLEQAMLFNDSHEYEVMAYEVDNGQRQTDLLLAGGIEDFDSLAHEAKDIFNT